MFYCRLLFLLLFLIFTAKTPTHAQESRQYLTFVRDGDIVMFDVASGTEVVLVEGANPERECSAWSPDGSRLAFQTASPQGGELSIFDIRSRDIFQIEVTSNTMESVSIIGCNWSLDSRWIAYRLYYLNPELEAEVHQFYIVEIICFSLLGIT